jgi:hypothetical protein
MGHISLLSGQVRGEFKVLDENTPYLVWGNSLTTISIGSQQKILRKFMAGKSLERRANSRGEGGRAYK